MNEKIPYFDSYIDSYFNVFQEKFYLDPSCYYFWPANFRDAEIIFFYCQRAENLKEIIFTFRFSERLNFFNDEAIFLYERNKELDAEERVIDIFPFLSKISQDEILKKFNDNPISKWDFDLVLFSAGVFYHSNQDTFRSTFVVSCYDFILYNKYGIHFYYYLKSNQTENCIFIVHKEKAIRSLIFYLSRWEIQTLNSIKLFEFLILIWGLFKFPLNDLYNITHLVHQKDIPSIGRVLKSYDY